MSLYAQIRSMPLNRSSFHPYLTVSHSTGHRVQLNIPKIKQNRKMHSTKLYNVGTNVVQLFTGSINDLIVSMLSFATS